MEDDLKGNLCLFQPIQKDDDPTRLFSSYQGYVVTSNWRYIHPFILVTKLFFNSKRAVGKLSIRKLSVKQNMSLAKMRGNRMSRFTDDEFAHRGIPFILEHLLHTEEVVNLAL